MKDAARLVKVEKVTLVLHRRGRFIQYDGKRLCLRVALRTATQARSLRNGKLNTWKR